MTFPQWRRVSRTFPVNDGTTKEPGHRLLFRDCPRRSRYYLVDFYVRTPPTCHGDIENVSGGGQITGRRSSIIEIYSVKLLEILNFTQKNCANVSREARILMKRKSLVRKKGSSIKGRRKG